LLQGFFIIDHICERSLNLTETKLLARIAVLAALGRHVQLRSVFQAAMPSRRLSTKIIETLLQVHLFGGFPASIEALRVFNEVYPRKNPGERNRNVPMSLHQRRKRGVDTCKRVYGHKYDGLLAAMRKLHPDLCAWMIEDGYGKVLARGGLTLVERELIAVATLAALGWHRQLHSHVKGCINVGTHRGIIIAVVRSVGASLPRKKFLKALDVTKQALQQKKS